VKIYSHKRSGKKASSDWLKVNIQRAIQRQRITPL